MFGKKIQLIVLIDRVRFVGVKASQFLRLAFDGGTNIIDIINAIIGKFQFLSWFVDKGFWSVLVSD